LHALNGALALAAKFFEDRFEKDTIFCQMTKIDRKQMKSILNYYLEALDFDLNIRE
jgi:hypothetical protein